MRVNPETMAPAREPMFACPLAVKLVVDAPPFMENKPLVIVDDASERKPFVKVTRPVCAVLPDTASEPNCAELEKRFVDDAVVAKKDVLVAEVVVEFEAVKFCRVVEPMTSRVDVAVIAPPKNPVPLTYEFPCTANRAEGLVVPMPTKPVFVRRYISAPAAFEAVKIG